MVLLLFLPPVQEPIVFPTIIRITVTHSILVPAALLASKIDNTLVLLVHSATLLPTI